MEGWRLRWSEGTVHSAVQCLPDLDPWIGRAHSGTHLHHCSALPRGPLILYAVQVRARLGRLQSKLEDQIGQVGQQAGCSMLGISVGPGHCVRACAVWTYLDKHKQV